MRNGSLVLVAAALLVLAVAVPGLLLLRRPEPVRRFPDEAAAASGFASLLVPATREGWRRGDVSLYWGERIYDRIDGAGEIFLEYGFVALAAAQYERGEEELSAGLYMMADEKAAFGIFSVLAEGDPVEGPWDAARCDGWTIWVLSGRWLLEVDAYEGEREAGLLSVARAVGERLEEAEGGGERPGVEEPGFGASGGDGLLYWRGPLGLRAALGDAVAPEDAGRFVEGFARRRENGMEFRLHYASEEEARAAAAALGARADGLCVYGTIAGGEEPHR